MEIIEIIKELYAETYSFLVAIFRPLQELLIRYYLDNPMLKIILAFVPAIIGIAYPLIIQTISRLNDQYKSTHIINQFKKEKLHIVFIWNLRISVGLTILCFILYIPIFVLAFISVVSLLILFFIYLNLLLSYQNGQVLFKIYLKKFRFDKDLKEKVKIKKPQKIKSRILKYWHPIIDLYKYSIQNKDRKLEYDIKDLFIFPSLGFIRYIDQRDEEYVLYPNEIYNSSFDIVLAYYSTNETNYYQNIEAYIGTMFFTENYGNIKPQFIHQETYIAIWRNIVVTIENKRTDKIKLFWHRAHQYCDYHLKIPYPRYDDNYKETNESSEERKKYEFNRTSFIQLCTVIGAYLYYKDECKTLKDIWFYTQSQPPNYILIPQSTESIFTMFFTFFNYEFYHSDIIIRFWFKDLGFDDMNNRKDVKYVVCEYLALLFLRLYVTKGYYGAHPISIYPKIPMEQQEKRDWEEKLPIFKVMIEKHLNRHDLIECLGLENLTKENCAQDGLDFPTEYIDKLIVKVQEGFIKTLEQSPLVEDKITSLNMNTVLSITKAFMNISRIKGDIVSEEDRDSISNHMEVIRGTRILLNREAFIENTSTHHLNAESITGEIIKENYYQHFATKVSLQKKKRKYTISTGDLFTAIEKLDLPAKEYCIISFGINIKYQKEYMGVAIQDPIDSEDYRFNNIPIYCYDNIPSRVFRVLYIIKNTDLPMIKHGDWSEIKDLSLKTQERWKDMDLIDNDLKIYSKIKELNNEPELRDEYISNGRYEEELKNQLEYDVDFLGYIWFNKKVELIEIKESDQFQEGGLNTSIETIRPIE